MASGDRRILMAILAASRTDAELQARADGGDLQSQMLLVDRLLVQAEAARANKANNPTAYGRAAARAMIGASMLTPRTRSPFAAYLYGRVNWQLRTVAASLMIAADLGDWRAKTWLRQFARQNPGMDTASALMVYRTLQHTWRVSPPE